MDRSVIDLGFSTNFQLKVHKLMNSHTHSHSHIQLTIVVQRND